MVVIRLPQPPGFIMQQDNTSTADNDAQNDFDNARLWTGAPSPALALVLEGTTSKPIGVPEFAGRGYSTLQGVLKGYAVETSEDTLSEHQLAEVTASLRVITSESELMEELRLHVSASFSSIGGGGGGSIDFFRRHTFNSYSLWLLAKVKVLAGGRQMSRYRLTTESRKLAIQGKRHFYERYGDEFVDAVVYGGELNILISFNTSSQQELETLQVSVHGQGGGFSAVGDLTQSMSSALKGSSFEMATYVSGYTGKLPEFNITKSATAEERAANLKALLDFINNFPKEISQHADKNILYYSTLPVQSCDDWPTKVRMDTRVAGRQIEDLAVLRRQGTRIRSSLEFIMQHPSQFIDPRIAEIETMSRDLDKMLLGIDRQAEDYMLAPWDEQRQGSYDFRPFERLLPDRRQLHRPTIIAEYTTVNDATVRRTAINLLDDGDWIGRHGGAYTALNSLMLQLDPPVYNSTLQFRVYSADNTTTPWLHEGERFDGIGTDETPNRPIVKFACNFSGAMAFAYQLEFKLHLSDTGDTATFVGGDALQGDSPAHPVEAIRISLKPGIS